MSVYPTDSLFWDLIAYCAGTGGVSLRFLHASSPPTNALAHIEYTLHHVIRVHIRRTLCSSVYISVGLICSRVPSISCHTPSPANLTALPRLSVDRNRRVAFGDRLSGWYSLPRIGEGRILWLVSLAARALPTAYSIRVKLLLSPPLCAHLVACRPRPGPTLSCPLAVPANIPYPQITHYLGVLSRYLARISPIALVSYAAGIAALVGLSQ